MVNPCLLEHGGPEVREERGHWSQGGRGSAPQGRQWYVSGVTSLILEGLR